MRADWGARRDSAKAFEMWWPGTELNRRRQPFQVLNNLSDFRWPPKYLRSRERYENRGWKSWVQNNKPC